MRLLILTQNENLYLPKSFATVCQRRPGDVVCIVSAPAMSTHGGPVKGFLKHWELFGTIGTARMVARVLKANLLARIYSSPDRMGLFGPLRVLRTRLVFRFTN